MSAEMLFEKMGINQFVKPLNKKLDKKMFYEQVNLKRQEKNLLQKHVERIELSYLLVPNTINIQPYNSEDYKYEGVMFITVMIRTGTQEQHIKGIIQLLHHALPHPAVVICEHHNHIRITTGQKRLNKVDQTKVVVEELHDSGWLSLKLESAIVRDFLDALQLSKLSFHNFFEFYQGIHKAVQAVHFSSMTGQFILTSSDELQQIIYEIEEIQTEINKYKQAIKKETQFNRKVEYNIKIHQLEQQLVAKRQQLEEKGE